MSSITRPHLLCVDDEPLILMAIERVLMDLDLQISTVNSGPQALAFLAENHVDIVLSDMYMPGMSGAELLTRVADDYPDTLRLVLSAQSSQSQLQQSLECADIWGFINKPWDNDELEQTIQTLITHIQVHGEQPS